MLDTSTLIDRPDLTAERLLLRRPSEHDVGAIVEVVGDWEVARRLARIPHPYSPADAMFFLEHVVPAEWVWAITKHGLNQLIGAVGLTPEDDGAVELGYWLSPAHWGDGVMTEAAGAVVSYGFDTLALSTIGSGYFEENQASGRVLHKLGFVETGRATRPCLAAGRDMPSVEMRLHALKAT